jgi:hypothetical protein
MELDAFMAMKKSNPQKYDSLRQRAKAINFGN